MSSTDDPTEFSRDEDYKHTSGSQDMARMIKGTNTRLIRPTRPEGRVETWPIPRKRGC